MSLWPFIDGSEGSEGSEGCEEGRRCYFDPFLSLSSSTPPPAWPAATVHGRHALWNRRGEHTQPSLPYLTQPPNFTERPRPLEEGQSEADSRWMAHFCTGNSPPHNGILFTFRPQSNPGPSGRYGVTLPHRSLSRGWSNCRDSRTPKCKASRLKRVQPRLERMLRHTLPGLLSQLPVRWQKDGLECNKRHSLC